MKLVDSHCHLHFEEFDDDRKDVVTDIEQELEFAVLAGCSAEDNLQAKNFAKTSDSLKFCMGLHPLYHESSDVSEVINQIRDSAISAVGEIGLDYNYITDKEEREETIEIFRQMLKTAEEEKLNVVVHSRNAEQKCFEIVQNYDVDAFFHCFNGRPELANSIASEGHKVGVTTQIIGSNRVRNIVEKIQLESLLLETDSPYLGVDGRNSPLNVVRVAEEIAEINSVDLDRVKRVSSENSENFFS